MANGRTCIGHLIELIWIFVLSEKRNFPQILHYILK